ncbi:hypothetical protein IAU60_005270 [Kwoniella sp. DSM 27419]
MPYAEPTTPPAVSPVKESPFHFHRKGHAAPPTHIEDIYDGPSNATGPMPGIPRRSSSQTGSSTPRRAMLDNLSRATHAIHSSFPASRPMEGLPRRSPSSGSSTMPSVPGLPSAESSSLGLKLHASPVKSPLLHRAAARDSPASISTNGSSLPGTPVDDSPTDPIHQDGDRVDHNEPTSPLPTFDPDFKPPQRSSNTRGLLSPTIRPTLSTMRRSSAGHIRGGQSGTGSLQIPITSSASTSELISAPGSFGGSSPSSLRPVSMIRKKSGEVVKPSLKQRSMSTPDLTRQAERSPTEEDDAREFGDERSKSVRFADTSEGDAKALESVVLFLREQKVTAVGKAADPDNATWTDTETERDTDADAADFVQFRTRRNAAARAQDENGQISLEGGSRVPRKRTDFSPDARGSLLNENVVLERVELQSGTGNLSLRGTAIVRNLAFQKWVAIRFTLDHWQTVSEVAGTHVCHIPAATTGDEGWDRFSFSIKLDDYKRKLDERQLLLCVHYSIEGRDWWDSNDGMNYNFTFRKGAGRRPNRSAGTASLASTQMREAAAENRALPGLRKANAPTPSSQMHKAFGSPTSGPSQWVFPKLAQRITDNMPSRPDSPALTPPPNSYKPPAPPSAATHLSLAKYCAPSPPQSPPKESLSEVPTAVLETVDAQRRASMNVLGGGYATLSPTDEAVHERRSSWNGDNSSWDSFAQALETRDTASLPSDGDATPVAQGSRSPDVSTNEASDTNSPEHKPLALKRSSTDLRKLVQDVEDSDNGLLTPPSSNLSSPPTPLHTSLPPIPMSPSPSASTGESSPVRTMSNESTPDLAGVPVEIEPELRGRTGGNQKMLSNSYQEFLDKFCFFQSPRMTPSELEPVYSRPSFIPISGHTSPNGFPFYNSGSGSHNSPRSTPTPTKQYKNAQEAFGFVMATPRPGPGPESAPTPAPINPTEQAKASVTAAK